ncbi:protein AHNAK2-like [Notechis scutatus]|uniref:Protein AHNAK2-like n=1 Tax=Notechis scutatus TaxID=8663 RepID=A0A6J1U4M3_9SAUR|nr:protein AHNAK2-like [Notechis scutatus]
MSDSQESMEVTLQTEVESGASGFSVAGGGAEGIFVKQVLKESPASNLFSLKEGDQLLSATIFFDNIKYEDALKILQYSEPYKVQFNLKRKLLGKDELEAVHSATQSKKEKLSQGMDTMEISEKTISEEDRTNLIVKQRVGRQKRTKKDRLSWPKFQSIKGKKILGHRRSRSTSDAYEHGIPDVSPTSTDTESQFQPEEIHGKIKKQSQKKLKFPAIGFKMHKKQEPYEINPFKEYENDTTVELSEIMTREYTPLDVDRKPKEKEPKRGVSETVFPLPQHTRKYPDVELTITKSKEKKLKSNLEFTKQEPTVATTQMKTAVIQTKDIADSQIKVSQNIPKMRKKKQKDSKVQTETQYQKEDKGKEPNIASKYALPQIESPKVEVDIKIPKMDLSLPKADHKATKPELKMEEIAADINISELDIKSKARQEILELKTTDQETNITSDEIPADGSAITLQDDENKFKMLKLQMPKFGISLPKQKVIPLGELSISSVEADFPKTAMKTELTTAEIEADIKLTDVQIEAPSLDMEIGENGKIKMPSLKMPSVKVAKLKAPEAGVSLPKVETDVTLPKGKAEVPEGAAAIKLPEAEGTIDGGGLKMHMPKFKMPSMGFSKPDIKGPKVDVDVSMPKVEASLPEAELCPAKPELKWDKPLGYIDMAAPEIIIPTGQVSLEVRCPRTEIKPPSSMAVQVPDVQLESGDSKFKMSKVQMPKIGISRPKGKGFSDGEVTIPSMEGGLPKTGLKMEITLPSSELEADITVPEMNREAPILDVEVEEKGKIKTPRVNLPSVKPPKLTAPEVDISLPKVEGDVSLPKAKAELPDSEAASKAAEAEGSREKGRMKIHMPKFKMPSMGFSKSDIKGPKIDSDASMPDVHTSLPKVELSTTKPQLKTDEFEGDIRIAAPEVKIPWVPVTVELQAPGVEVQASSGKIPDIAIGLSKDVDVPQLKTTADIIDIAVEASTLEMESDVLGEKKDVLEQKIKMPQIIRADVKTSAVGIPSVDISVTQSEVSTQDLHGAAKEPKAKGQITKRESLDGEEKGHFKMPKFKLPSLSWSPKKEASLKTNIKEPLQESNLGIVSVDTGTEPKVTLSEDQGAHTDGNVDIATKKSQVKRPHLSMPKISLSKTKLPKAEVDTVVEGDGALVQIPDIENSFTTRKVEETEISVKMLKGDIKEIKTFQTDPDISLLKTDTKVSMTKSSFEQKCLETEFKGDICLDSASVKSDGTEGEFRMPKLKMPKFGISDLSESEISDLSGSGITLSKPESDASQFQMTTESEELGGKTQPLQVKSDEGTSEEIQTEESQSWFKMPKFKMPSFGRTSKAKRSGAEIEDITGEAHVTELQAEVKSPEVVTISRELDSEKNTSEQKVMLPKEDVRVQKEQQSTTDQLMDEGSFLQSSEKIGRKSSDLEHKTYADIVKDGAEGQSSQTEFSGTIPKMDIDRNIPKTKMTIQQPQVIPDIMAVAEIPPTEITMEKKIDASITDPEPLQSLDRQAEEMGAEKKSPKKDSQGKESIFKMPTFSMPLFGWSTTKSDAIVPGIESDLEEPAVTLSKVKVGVSITDEDFEIIDFPVEGFEKDLPKEGEVKAEEKEKTSKMKASKFKIPKFANLRSKSQGGEMQVDSPKVQTEVSLVRPEGETSGIQFQDKKLGDAEESFQKPKFKMLKFTHRISEGEKLTSEETVDIKDTADGDISQLQFKTMFPEEKGDDIQKSKARITTLSEPAIQRPQVGSKFQSTDSSFVGTTMYVHKQVPKEFSAEFLKEKMDTMDSNIQKSIAKITTLKEPDIQTAPLEIKLQPDDPFSSSETVQVKGSITESKEIKMESKSSFGCGDIAEIQESFSTQIVKESEIPPSEVKTAAFGFSLLKVKIQESHVSLDVPVKLSSTKCMGEIFEDKDHQLSGTGEAAQKADKDKDITYEYIEGTSSAATLTTLKSFTVDIQSSGEFAESHSEPIEISKSAIETAGEMAFTSNTDEVTDEKDSKRSGGFKLWFPSIGFSTDDTTSESKPEAQQKVQPDDSSKLDNDTAKETEKAGWFKFPKLGFSSPTKKSKEEGKEKETDSKEGKGEESPTDKNETFFDAQETLPLKEKEENETSGDIPSEPIVSSSARTELILLEKGKAEPKHTPEDPSK